MERKPPSSRGKGRGRVSKRVDGDVTERFPHNALSLRLIVQLFNEHGGWWHGNAKRSKEEDTDGDGVEGMRNRVLAELRRKLGLRDGQYTNLNVRNIRDKLASLLSHDGPAFAERKDLVSKGLVEQIGVLVDKMNARERDLKTGKTHEFPRWLNTAEIKRDSASAIESVDALREEVKRLTSRTLRMEEMLHAAVGLLQDLVEDGGPRRRNSVSSSSSSSDSYDSDESGVDDEEEHPRHCQVIDMRKPLAPQLYHNGAGGGSHEKRIVSSSEVNDGGGEDGMPAVDDGGSQFEDEDGDEYEYEDEYEDVDEDERDSRVKQARPLVDSDAAPGEDYCHSCTSESSVDHDLSDSDDPSYEPRFEKAGRKRHRDQHSHRRRHRKYRKHNNM